MLTPDWFGAALVYRRRWAWSLNSLELINLGPRNGQAAEWSYDWELSFQRSLHYLILTARVIGLQRMVRCWTRQARGDMQPG